VRRASSVPVQEHVGALVVAHVNQGPILGSGWKVVALLLQQIVLGKYRVR